MSTSSQALQCLNKLKKPSDSEAKVLSKLFPSSKRSAASTIKTFDPADELVVKEAKRKKKSTSKVKSSQVEICLLPNFVQRVPKGKQRGDLKQQGRIKKIPVCRHHNWWTIQQSITSSFGSMFTTMMAPTILTCDGIALSKADNQQPNGEVVINRRGSFYISDGSAEDPICLTVSPLYIYIYICAISIVYILLTHNQFKPYGHF